MIKNSTKESVDYSQFSIAKLADIIHQDWKKLPRGGRELSQHPAGHYLMAMFNLEEITDKYGCDSGSSVVSYFLSNATGWRGDVARQVKAELNKRLK